MENINGQNQMSLFSSPQEKGRSEWGTFNAVRNDTVGAYRVATPRKHETPRYPNTVHISRYPRHLTLRTAR